MIKQLLCLTVLLFMSVHLVLAQDNFVTGTVVTAEGKKQQGQIDYRDWRMNPKEITFRSSPQSLQTSFTIKELKSFEVDEKIYERGAIRFDSSSVNLNMMSDVSEPQYKLDTVFLKCIINGDKGIYLYIDHHSKSHFFIRNGEIFEYLIYKRYKVITGSKIYIAENNNYLGQLSAYLQDCPSLGKLLKNTRYNEESLKKLFSSYYACTDKQLVYSKKKEGMTVEAGILAETYLGSLKFKSEEGYRYLTQGDIGQSIGFSGGIFADLILPGGIRKWSILNELAYTTYQFDGEYYPKEVPSTNYTLSGRFSYIKLSNMFRYKIPVGESSAMIFFNAGISNGFLIQKKATVKTVYSNDFYTRESESPLLNSYRVHEQTYLVGAGGQYKKWSAEVRFENGNGFSAFQHLGTSTRKFSLMLGYRFL